MANVKLKEGWLARDTKKAATYVAELAVRDAERHVRQLNDELADANTALKAAKGQLSKIRRGVR